MREQDGILRKAKGDERDRLNQIYFPQPGRKVKLGKIRRYLVELEPDKTPPSIIRE